MIHPAINNGLEYAFKGALVVNTLASLRSGNMHFTTGNCLTSLLKNGAGDVMLASGSLALLLNANKLPTSWAEAKQTGRSLVNHFIETAASDFEHLKAIGRIPHITQIGTSLLGAGLASRLLPVSGKIALLAKLGAGAMVGYLAALNGNRLKDSLMGRAEQIMQSGRLDPVVRGISAANDKFQEVAARIKERFNKPKAPDNNGSGSSANSSSGSGSSSGGEQPMIPVATPTQPNEPLVRFVPRGGLYSVDTYGPVSNPQPQETHSDRALSDFSNSSCGTFTGAGSSSGYRRYSDSSITSSDSDLPLVEGLLPSTSAYSHPLFTSTTSTTSTTETNQNTRSLLGPLGAAVGMVAGGAKTVAGAAGTGLVGLGVMIGGKPSSSSTKQPEGPPPIYSPPQTPPLNAMPTARSASSPQPPEHAAAQSSSSTSSNQTPSAALGFLGYGAQFLFGQKRQVPVAPAAPTTSAASSSSTSRTTIQGSGWAPSDEGITVVPTQASGSTPTLTIPSAPLPNSTPAATNPSTSSGQGITLAAFGVAPSAPSAPNENNSFIIPKDFDLWGK